MAPPPEFPSKLVTAFPPWSEGSEENNAPEPTPQPFNLTLPHVIRRNTHLYKSLGDMDDLTDQALKERLIPLCRELQEFQEKDQEQIHGLSKALVAKYGELSVRVIRRAWDLNLALTTTTAEFPGDDGGIFDQTAWLTAIRRFAEDFQILTKFQEEGEQSVFVTDVLVQEHADRVKRAEKEREVFAAMHEELTQSNIEDMPADKSTALSEAPLSALRRCLYTAQTFHKTLRDQGEEVPENEEEEVKWMYQAKQLWHIAGRAAMGWEPRRIGEMQGILQVYCQDLLTRPRREGFERDASLRAQLEAILGDTRGGKFYIASDDDESDEDADEGKGKENAD
ncbi:hypothetical protein ACHAPT_004879 [Fusarium lateritium]